MPVAMESKLDAYRRAATKGAPSFQDVPADPVDCATRPDFGKAELQEIVRRYWAHGFAVIAMPDGADPRRVILDFAARLHLGQPFVPPLYTIGGYRGEALNRISVEWNGDIRHPSFETTKGLPLHCDGTLQPLGIVKNSTLFCQSSAPVGGETVLFNAAAAFAELLKRDPDGSLALTSPDVLTRTANINGSRESHVGPAFEIRNGKIVCGYSTAKTDSWSTAAQTDPALRRALSFFRNASDSANPASRYLLSMKLAGGQMILMDNGRLSHGRKEYQNTAEQVRVLFRGLFLKHPIGGGAAR